MKIAITTALLAMTTMAAADPTASCEGGKTSLTIKVIGPSWRYDASFDDTVGATTVRDTSGRTLASLRTTPTGKREVSLSPRWTPELARSVANDLLTAFDSEQVQGCTSASNPFHPDWDDYYCPILIFIWDEDLHDLLCKSVFF
jgi:hypothetical protein